jgi:hypothetical protein
MVVVIGVYPTIWGQFGKANWTLPNAGADD